MSKRQNTRLTSFLRRKRVRITLLVIGVLILIRILLPYIALHYANKTLASMPGYFGHIEDIDLSLYRGSYQIQGMYLDKQDSATRKRTEFFKVREIDLSVEWKALMNGKIAGELDAYNPSLVFTKDKTELADVKKDTNDFRKILKDFMPLSVNRFSIHNGSLQYVDKGSKPPVDISLKEIYVTARNVNNSYDSAKALPASVVASAKAYEGELNISMRLNPLAETPTFDLNAELTNTNLVLMNDFLMAYGNFDVNKGNFGLYTEMAAKEGRFKGYVKPVIKDLDVVGLEDKKDNFLRKTWEAVVGFAGDVFKNQKKDQVATNIPLEGKFENPRSNTWEAVWEILKNAFVQALVPSVDNRINLSSIDEEKKEDKNLLQRIFSGDKDKEKDKKKN